MNQTDEVASLTSLWQYHQRSKHHMQRYAAGPDSIDWDQQPDPFRRFDGCELIRLPLLADAEVFPWAAMWLPHCFEARSLSLASLALLLEQSLALSAWKQYGSSRWSLRCNPSSGNLHPTETTLLLAGIDGLADGVYHYRPDLHALELRARLGQPFPYRGIWLGFSSLIWREAWKYGERAWRYCQHDVGHARAAVAFAAHTLGWPLAPVRLDDTSLERLLGLAAIVAPAEPECADCLLALGPDSVAVDSATLVQAWLTALADVEWQGRASVVDVRHLYQWPVLDDAVQLARIADTTSPQVADELSEWPTPLVSHSDHTAARLIRQRRSAQAFDRQTLMPQADFFTLLDHSLPRPTLAPWNSLAHNGAVHLLLFVHRVEGLPSGLYALPRNGAVLADLQQTLREEFRWQRVEQAPAHLPLYCLLEAKAERTAARLSCQQAIAADSCFSLAMLADLQPMAEQPWWYRECLQEAGAIGQQLYLDAEACGFRGTGIGCFYDDAVHELLGLTDERWQSLYHFTVGAALHDPRIVSWPPYRR